MAELSALALLLAALVWRVPRLEIWESLGGSSRVAWALGTACLALGLARLRAARHTPAPFGFAPRNWVRGWPALAAATAAAALALAALGWWLGTFSLAAARWRWLEVYAGGIAVQQILLESVFYCGFHTAANRSGCADPPRTATRAAALLFALLHAPNPALVVGTGVAALYWTRHFERFRNLPALMLSHLALGVAAMVALGPGPLLDLRVGPDAWERLSWLERGPG